MTFLIDLQELADELDFDLEDVEMIMESFIENSRVNLEILEKSIQNDDIESIRLSSHSIKGSASNLLLNDIYNVARDIEKNAIEHSDIDYNSLYAKLKNLIDRLTNE